MRSFLWLVLLGLVVMVAGLGCGKKEETKPDTSATPQEPQFAPEPPPLPPPPTKK